jgi:hypothetical protein
MALQRISTPICFALIALLLHSLAGCSMQRRFDSPDQAVNSLVSAFRADNQEELHQILGRDGDELLSSGDPVNDEATFKRFLTAYDEKHQLVKLDENMVRLDVGNDEWPMPIPLVREFNQWRFDTDAGKEELINRRIGRNELDTMQVCLAIVDAQREYAERDPEHVGLPTYAQKFFSDPGKKNGLYWQTGENETPSPLGPIAAEAESQGYSVPNTNATGPQAYHGYYYRMLKSQGPDAHGGARDYVVNGHLIGGFAVMAYPADHGNSGIMTFIVNQDGVLYQRDLGNDTAKAAARISAFNPDSHWTKVDPNELTDFQEKP